MIGPSSSHTAGAARLARIARAIVAQPFYQVSFGLHGSFAKTYKGHGTDRALLAGALGIREDDERLADAFSLAAQHNLAYEFYEIELDGYHENSVKMTFSLAGGTTCTVIGSSTGGGGIVIRRVDDFEVEFDAQLPTLLISQKDCKGIVSDVTRILADNEINIGVMRLSRSGKGGEAICIIETDGLISSDIVNKIRSVENVLSVRAVQANESEN